MINLNRLIFGHPIQRMFLHTDSTNKALTGNRDGVVQYKGFCAGKRERVRHLAHLHDGQCDVREDR